MIVMIRNDRPVRTSVELGNQMRNIPDQFSNVGHCVNTTLDAKDKEAYIQRLSAY